MICMTLMALMPILRWVGILLTGRLLRNRRPHWVYCSLITIHIPYLVGVWSLERISHLSRRRRIMETKKRIRLLLAALLSLSGVLPAAADASDWLPLAVGNSWTYEHAYLELNGDSVYEPYYAYIDTILAHLETGPPLPRFTIEVLRTEVIDGKTYYVISDMPANWPPPPPHFIAGKKLRWQGTHLMERTPDGEQAIFRFDGVNEAVYEFPMVEGDHGVKVWTRTDPVPLYTFGFRGPTTDGSVRACSFIKNYGIIGCRRSIFGTDHPVFENTVDSLWAVLGGTRVEIENAGTPTSTSSSSWGQVKQSFWAAGSNLR